jgi:UDP-N-acetylglucosamine 4,6-dehydratase/5-epimerase
LPNTVLITGGSGFLGQAMTKYLLAETDWHIKIYSRDEFKQWVMASEINDPRVKYIIGDVRDRARVFESAKGCDYIVHASALKHVWCGEQHPWEVIQTNIHGTKNVVDAANEVGAKMVLVSTDKAMAPANLYGCTKMAAECITLNGNQRVVRYGNVFGSRGSILHKFKEWTAKGHTFKITDFRMTRFVITIQEAIDLVMETLNMPAGTINIPILPAMRIVDLAKAFDENAVIEEIGAFPGEKLHESLSATQSSEDAVKMTIPEIRKLIEETI